MEAFAPGQPGLVKLIKEQVETTLPAHLSKRVERRYVEGDSAPLDLATLPHLSQASILEATRVHHSNNQVYSSVGPILISVNPYQTIPELYSSEQHERYLDVATTATTPPLPPHLYQIAAKAFRGATCDDEGKNQSIVLSGESGGGKTMASRLLTEFLVFCSSNSPNSSSVDVTGAESQQSRVQHLLVQAVPLIESFGNAKTERNDNSSRFGCWTEINFADSAVCGAQLRAFNLEKSRVVSTAAGQRNFHIFYQFVSSLPLGQGEGYRYLAGAGSAVTLDDRTAFDVTKTTMQQLGLDEQAMLQVLHGILELGNVEFHQVEEHAAAVISNPDQVALACAKLGLDVHELSQALVRRDMSNSKEVIYTPYSQSQAEGTRDALAKHLYGRLFDWVLASINTNMAQDHPSNCYVGLLDMYGFEIFATNSLEQLCINYCNERIMESFNTKYIYDEAEFYRSEGISTNLDSIKRDRLVLDLLESNPTGIFNLLDEECKIPKGSDFGLLKRMRKQLVNAKFVPHVPQQENLFAIAHFASTVRYSVVGFLEKNRDTLPSQIEALCQTAVGLVGSDLFGQSEVPALLTRQRSTSAFQKVSLSSRFRNDLRELMDKVEHTETHFVRCIKPNASGSPTEFHGSMVLAQLSYSGVLETCRLRQEHGYELRQTHDEFTRRQARYFPSCAHPESASELVREINLTLGTHILVGLNFCFVSSKDLELLDTRSTTVHTKAVLAMQAFARMAVEKKRHQERKDFLVKLELALLRQPEPNFAVLDELVHGSEVRRLFPFQGQHLALVRRGHQVCQQLERGWLLQLQAVEQAIANRDMVTLKLWLDTQSSYGHGSSSSNARLGEIVAKAKHMLRELQREEAAKTLQRAVRLFLFQTKVRRGFADLAALHAQSKPEEIAPVIRRMAKLGLAKHPEVHRVKQFVPTTLQRPGRRGAAEGGDYGEEEEQPTPTSTSKGLADLGNLKLAVALARQRLQARSATAGDAIAVRKEIDGAQSRGAVPFELQDALQVEAEVWAFVSSAKRRKLSWWQKLVSCGGCVPQTHHHATIPKTTRELV